MLAPHCTSLMLFNQACLQGSMLLTRQVEAAPQAQRWVSMPSTANLGMADAEALSKRWTRPALLSQQQLHGLTRQVCFQGLWSSLVNTRCVPHLKPLLTCAILVPSDSQVAGVFSYFGAVMQTRNEGCRQLVKSACCAAMLMCVVMLHKAAPAHMPGSGCVVNSFSCHRMPACIAAARNFKQGTTSSLTADVPGLFAVAPQGLDPQGAGPKGASAQQAGPQGLAPGSMHRTASYLTSLGLCASFQILLVMNSSFLWPLVMKSDIPLPMTPSFL